MDVKQSDAYHDTQINDEHPDHAQPRALPKVMVKPDYSGQREAMQHQRRRLFQYRVVFSSMLVLFLGISAYIFFGARPPVERIIPDAANLTVIEPKEDVRAVAPAPPPPPEEDEVYEIVRKPTLEPTVPETSPAASRDPDEREAPAVPTRRQEPPKETTAVTTEEAPQESTKETPKETTEESTEETAEESTATVSEQATAPQPKPTQETAPETAPEKVPGKVSGSDFDTLVREALAPTPTQEAPSPAEQSSAGPSPAGPSPAGQSSAGQVRYFVQVGSFLTQTQADLSRARFARLFPERADALTIFIARVNDTNRYRVQYVQRDRQSAVNWCQQLSAQQISCLVTQRSS